MSLEKIKTTVLQEAKARAEQKLDEARKEAERLLAEGRHADERTGGEVIRDAKLRFEREANRELERIQYDNRLEILSAKNKAIDEVFRRVDQRIGAMTDAEYVSLVGAWLARLPANVGGVLRVNPKDEAKFTANLESLNAGRSGAGLFTGVAADPGVATGAVVDGLDYNIDCTIDRRLGELRESAAGDLARVLFGA